MSVTRFDQVSEQLTGLAGRTPETRLRPEAFFVARAGVLTLAYRGFPVPVLAFKRELERVLPGIPDEYPGSRWPKTTLAALIESDPLTPDEIVLLREATQEGTVCLSRLRRGMRVEALHLVELHCRSMERVGRRAVLPLGGGVDDGKVPAEHRAVVNEVLTQWRREGLARYVPELMRTEYRESHYRRAYRELSLVVAVGASFPCMDRFRDAVERRLPGRYAWFRPDSLHVTVRSLGPLTADGSNL